MRPVIHSIARTIRCSRRQLVVGNAGDKASKMGRISVMGFRLLSCLGGTYNFNKYVFEGRHYIPLGDRQTIALRAWYGTLGNASGTPNALPAARRATSDPAAAKALVDMGTQVREYVRSLPLRPGTTPLKFAPDYETWLIEAMSHGDYDAFWKDIPVSTK